MTAAKRSLAYAGQIVDQVREALEEMAESYAERGRTLAELGTAGEIAERMVATVPAPSAWNEILGPFYSTPKLARILGGVSRQALADRRKRRSLLGLRTVDGAVVYPLFQFNERNEVLPGLSDVLQTFDPDDVDDWTLAAWLVAPQRSLGGSSIVRWLASGRPSKVALDLARAQASRYRR
ncbi:MAG TPA: hypothetical protein VJH87_09745 [Vicinamibacteria bacterium]|nr:hypothetical protein [Vicinamibacteria bacterium]